MVSVVRENVPPNPGPQYPIIRVTKAGTRMFRCQSPQIWGFYCHWTGKDSVPCTGQNQSCNGCVKGLPRRWKGYLHVVDLQSHLEGFLELTPLSATCVNDQTAADFSLRGCRLQVVRGNGGAHSRLRITVLPDLAGGQGLRESKDPIITLGRLWELRNGFGPDA